MNQVLKILAVVPARAGSKRLIGKNKLLLGEKSLVARAIECVKGITEVCDILVSTDCSEIATIAAGAGGLVPWLRPASLATDSARPADVVLHALDWYEEYYGSVDGVLWVDCIVVQ